jgi:hypothetical protein
VRIEGFGTRKGVRDSREGERLPQCTTVTCSCEGIVKVDVRKKGKGLSIKLHCCKGNKWDNVMKTMRINGYTMQLKEANGK